jgi:predicted nucleic acid-binding protein
MQARELYEQHGRAGSLLVSTQVLQKFYVTVTRKLAEPLNEADAYEVVRELSHFSVVRVDAELVLAAIRRARTDKFSFWDGLIIEAALLGGATRLLSEDLQHGRMVNALHIENPFKA